MKKSIFLLLCCLAANIAATQTRICTKYVAQTYTDSTFMALDKRSLSPGKIYARCWIAPEYETFLDSNFTVSPQIVRIKPLKMFHLIEPVIAEVVDSVVEKSGQREWILNIKQNSYRKMKILPAIYTTTSNIKEISPAFTRWILKRGDMNGLSQNPDDCIVFAFAELPAQYETAMTRTELKPPRKIVDNDTLNLDSTELKRFGTMHKSTQKITYYHEVLQSIGRIIRYNDHFDYNIKYPTTTKKLVRSGGFSEWKECACGCAGGGSIEPLHVQNIQKALKARGYYKGKINNILDAKTKAAVVKFQKDNGLPIGAFDLQTMRALNVKAFE